MSKIDRYKKKHKDQFKKKKQQKPQEKPYTMEEALAGNEDAIKYFLTHPV